MEKKMAIFKLIRKGYIFSFSRNGEEYQLFTADPSTGAICNSRKEVLEAHGVMRFINDTNDVIDGIDRFVSVFEALNIIEEALSSAEDCHVYGVHKTGRWTA